MCTAVHCSYRWWMDFKLKSSCFHSDNSNPASSQPTYRILNSLTTSKHITSNPQPWQFPFLCFLLKSSSVGISFHLCSHRVEPPLLTRAPHDPVSSFSPEDSSSNSPCLQLPDYLFCYLSLSIPYKAAMVWSRNPKTPQQKPLAQIQNEAKLSPDFRAPHSQDSVEVLSGDWPDHLWWHFCVFSFCSLFFLPLSSPSIALSK